MLFFIYYRNDTMWEYEITWWYEGQQKDYANSKDLIVVWGNEEKILHIFDSAVKLLDQERENKIKADEMNGHPSYMKKQADIDFINKRKSSEGHTITQTIKHILKKQQYVPWKDDISLESINYLQSEKDTIIELKDSYFNRTTTLNQQAETVEDRMNIDRINEKIKKMTEVAKAYKEYIREYNEEIFKSLQ